MYHSMKFEDLHPEVNQVIPIVDRAAEKSPLFNENDYSTDFKTDKVWPDRDSLLVWAREVGRKRNMVLTIGKSWGSKEGRYGKVLLACERYGNQRCRKKMHSRKEEEEEEEEEGEQKKRRVTKSKKSGCQFALHGREVKRNEWRLEVDCGVHNHDLPASLEGHAFIGRLTEKELLSVKDLSESGSKPKMILSKLKLDSKMNMTSRRQIYNALQKLRKKPMEEQLLC